MKKLLLALIMTVWGLGLGAQTVAEEIHQDILRTASNYMAYPGPLQVSLTPAPPGMKPFYISHYGRHGSRFHTKPSMYNAPYNTLAKADSLGKLTPLGRDVMRRLDIIRHDAEGRWGELTPLGAEQVRQIAYRMFNRFPEAFEERATIDARSTSVARCIMSMEHTLLQLQQLNPEIKIHHNATERDLDFLNLQDKKLFALKTNDASKKLYSKFIKDTEKNTRLMQSLFNDTAYINHHVNTTELDFQLLLIASIMQNVELGKQITLFDLYTEDELYRNWKIGNARWYIGWGACPVNDGVQPFTQRYLLRRIISDADSCINIPKNNITLRFGHETVLMPLVCLLDLNGYGVATSDLNKLESLGWVNYRIFPMAANLQFIFYRRHPKDTDVVFKVLLNENEATLPLPTNMPPYYKWSDFREYYLKKLMSYDEK